MSTDMNRQLYLAMINSRLRTFLIPFLILFVFTGCDQHFATQEDVEKTKLEELSATHPLSENFLHTIKSSSLSLSTESVLKEKIKRLTVARKEGGTVQAVVAPLNTRTVSKINPIRIREDNSEFNFHIANSRVIFIPSINELYRFDQHYIDSNNKEGYLRFQKLGTKATAVLKLEGGSVTRTIRKSEGISTKDMTTTECLDAAAEGCGADGECAILCAVTSPWCEVAIVVSCAVAANN